MRQRSVVVHRDVVTEILGTGVRPVLVGYIRMSLGTGSAARWWLRQMLTSFAAREGYALDDVLVQSALIREGHAIEALVTAVQLRGARAIVVPKMTHLGVGLHRQVVTRQWLEREAGVPVLAVEKEENWD